MDLLNSTIARVVRPDESIRAAARARQDILTKPNGSLGDLEGLSVKIAGIVGSARPRLKGSAIFLMAGDHGVAARGVSAYPSEVTVQMLANILHGGAGINVLARCVGARVVATDVGIAADFDAAPGLYIKKVRRGTADMSIGPAMSRDEARRSIEAGIEVFETELACERFSIAATGDLGIGNTTPSTALAALFSGRPPRDIAGRGTGLDDAGLERKIAVVERALAVNKPESSDPLGALARVGGLEIGAIAGTILAAAADRIPVVVDGFISGAGALVAAGLCPASADYMIAGHLSGDVGHRVMLETLGLEPLLSLGLRLGEGTGAALAISVCEAACRVLDEMATFGEAGVAEKGE
jgi:nicotinate-nucleotide--dimethylbenzimidazole phosphoribosyltransferase